MDNSEGVQAFSPEARLGDTDRSHHQAPKVRRQPVQSNPLGELFFADEPTLVCRRGRRRSQTPRPLTSAESVTVYALTPYRPKP